MPCYFPFKKEGENIPLPCGKCPYCLQRRANNWVFRCMQHAKIADTAHWCTFTYVQPSITPNGFMTVQKRSLQLFFKRLRFLYPKEHPPIKYYACGEYGDKTERPHYHAIIFNADQDKILKAWEGVYGEVENGLVHFDLVNENTIMYTAKYMNKGKLIPKFKEDDRTPEFQLFSKGLGLNYLTDQTIKFHKADIMRLYATVGGFKKALPRYFRLKIYNELEREQQALIAQERSNEVYNTQYEEYLLHRSKGQTFEQFRFARKNNAIDHFKKVTSSRKKL